MFRDLFSMGINTPSLECLLGGSREHSKVKVKIYETLLKFISNTNKIKAM